ncbi:hypothetical protein AOZ06_28200 [Kibdelosporangium phytohabitans]|uniref:Uncharacterized protein n=1 Tax=Kibdelosporangium phytohabitans TaxID=860235 RepID=A0A0N9HSR7_9PSEU|nr:hypothetical protein AOZ06_28200 [Kibdelosporangium phytohabitans]
MYRRTTVCASAATVRTVRFFNSPRLRPSRTRSRCQQTDTASTATHRISSASLLPATLTLACAAPASASAVMLASPVNRAFAVPR